MICQPTPKRQTERLTNLTEVDCHCASCAYMLEGACATEGACKSEISREIGVQAFPAVLEEVGTVGRDEGRKGKEECSQ